MSERPNRSERAKCLALPFVTVDLACRADRVWRVIELGDGQVSDRAVSTPAADLINALPGH